MEVNPKSDKVFGGIWAIEANRLYRIYPKKAVILRGNLRSINVTGHNAAVVGSDGLTRAAAGAVLGFLVAGPVGTVLGAGAGSGGNSSKSETYSVILAFASGEVMSAQVTPFELEALRGHLQSDQGLASQPKNTDLPIITKRPNSPPVVSLSSWSNDSIIKLYTESAPNPENTAQIVAQIASGCGISTAKVRSILVARGVYVTQGKPRSLPQTSGVKPATMSDVPRNPFKREGGPREMRAGGGTRWQGASGKTYATRAEALEDGYTDFVLLSQHHQRKREKGASAGVWMVVSILIITLAGLALLLMRDAAFPVKDIVAAPDSNYTVASDDDTDLKQDNVKPDISASVVDADNKRRYEALSEGARKEVDAKMRAYDQACAETTDC